jgi:hypothetical protein
MTKHEVSKFSMYKTVFQVLKNNQGEFKNIPALNSSIDDLEKNLNEIAVIDNKYQNIGKGNTAKKDNTKDEIVDSLIKVSGVLYVTGRSLKNENLKEISDLCYSDLRKMRGNDLINKANLIIENANANIEKMKTIHTDIDSEIKILAGKIEEFDAAMNEKETKNIESHTARLDLNELFIETDDMVCGDMDTLIELIKTKNPDLYKQYQTARVIRDLHGKKHKKEEEITVPV